MTSLAAQPVAWPAGSGGMAGRLRAHAWAGTPLGPVEGWPGGLRAVVDLMLASPLVSSLAWALGASSSATMRRRGSTAIAIPGALGRPLPETWPEAYASVIHLYERAFADEAVHVPAQPLDVSRPGGEVFDTVLTPVRDAAGVLVAVQMTGFEVGARAGAEERLRVALAAADLGAWGEADQCRLANLVPSARPCRAVAWRAHPARDVSPTSDLRHC